MFASEMGMLHLDLYKWDRLHDCYPLLVYRTVAVDHQQVV